MHEAAGHRAVRCLQGYFLSSAALWHHGDAASAAHDWGDEPAGGALRHWRGGVVYRDYL